MFLQAVDANDAQLLRIIASAGAVSGAVYPAPTPSPPLTPTSAVSPDFWRVPSIATTDLVDATGRLSMAVPSSWTDTETFTGMNDDATDRLRLAAAPDLDGFYNDWLVPGVEVIAFPFKSDPSVLLHNLGYTGRCADGGVQTFDNGTLSGLMQTWSACGGTPTRNVQLAISPTDQAVTLFIEAQLPDADNSSLQAVLSSLRIT